MEMEGKGVLLHYSTVGGNTTDRCLIGIDLYHCLLPRDNARCVSGAAVAVRENFRTVID